MPFSTLRLYSAGGGPVTISAITGYPSGSSVIYFVPVTVGDDGGELVEVPAGWPSIPHTVQINVGADAYPCYSGRAGEAYAPVPQGGSLRFIIPADLPVGGPYDVEITSTTGTYTLAGAINVWRRHRRLRAYELAGLFTRGVFARGLAALTDGPVLDATGVLVAAADATKAIIGGIGQQSNDTNGLIFTRLTADLPPALAGTVVPAAALAAEVETTHGFPDAGVVILPGGETCAYTSRTLDTLVGLGRDNSVSETYPRGAPVALVGQWSAFDDARGSLITATAEGGFLDSIGQNYGVGRLQGANDDLYRGLIEVFAYQAGKGSDSAVCEVLHVVLGPLALGADDGVLSGGNTLTSATGGFTARMVGLRVRINGLVYLISGYTSANQVTLSPTGSHFWNAAALPNSTGNTWEVVPCDVLPDPWRPGIALVRINVAPATSPIGYGYIQGGEVVTPVGVGAVTVAHQIRQVLGVWLATDTQRAGTNYATTNTFAGNVITLDAPLPGLVDVLVDYGSTTQPVAPTAGIPGAAGGVATAQLLADVTERNPGAAGELRYPLYLGDRIGQIRELLRILTAAGIRAEPDLRTW